MLTVCADCGTPYEKDGRGDCPECRPVQKDPPGRGTRHARGYDAAWTRLSARARRLQPFCLDCGSPYDLTADHSPAAWERRAAGKAIRLEDIDVVCRGCNSARGAARGDAVSHFGGQGKPIPDDEGCKPIPDDDDEADDDDDDDEGCDGLCEGLCPEHRDPRG